MLFLMIPMPNEPPVKRPIDDKLILRIADGDTDALRTLYDGVHGAVYGFALSILRDPQDAADVLQDTFLRIYTKADGYQPCGKPLAWIFTIARRLATDKLRERARTCPMEQVGEAAIAADHVADAEQRLLLESLLNRLTDEERQILILHTVRGIKHREIAAVLELPLGTVLSKYHRAVKRLQALAKEETL